MGEREKPQSAAQWAELLKAEREERARSHYRRFFIASHPDWEDAEAWSRLTIRTPAYCLNRREPKR